MIRRIIIILSIAAVAASCDNTRFLTGRQRLYVGSEIKIVSSEPIGRGQVNDLKSDLKSLLRPRPNSKTLGMRVNLALYNLAGDTSKKAWWRRYLRNKLGEPPVLYTQAAADKNARVLQSRLASKGYFRDSVYYDTVDQRKKVEVRYTALIGAQYHLDTVTLPSGDDTLSLRIREVAGKYSLLKAGDPFDLDAIKAERSRIDAELKDRGFYYFSADDLEALLDTTVGNHRVRLDLSVKPVIPLKARDVYRINKITVYPNYDNHFDSAAAAATAITTRRFTMLDPTHMFKPLTFRRVLVFKPGDIYSRDNHNLSLNRLATLGTFRFVRARFAEPDSGNKLLNAYYYLTPLQRKSIQFQASILTRSNNANGGELSVNWLNRNTFHGAEALTVRVYGGLESQIATATSTIATERVGTDVALTFPRIIGPLPFNTKGGFVPKTRFEVGYEIFNRSDQYALNTFKAGAGYIWKNNINNEHQLNIVNINYVNPVSITPAFALNLDTNITLRRSIERRLIIGSNYNYNYNSLTKENYRRNNYYFNANIDLAGNLLGAFTGANVRNGKERSIADVPFAQYIRTELDFRHYMRFSRYAFLVSRALIGVGYAYGNSVTMPYIKEFFAGGVSDIRAFRSRGLGPGSYYAGDTRRVGFIPDQPGDIKFELNAEYRAKLFSVVRGAAFVDAGNVWSMKEDLARPGSQFTGDFMKQMAVGAGVGLRFDVSILVLRLDLAFPLRKPWLPDGQQWVIGDISPGSSAWRRDNLVLNLAIGYPF